MNSITTQDRPNFTTQEATGSLLEVVGAATQVPLIDGSWISYANLDVAASAPALQAVADRVAEVLPLYASVHRGAGYLSQVSTALYEQCRTVIGNFVGARDQDVTIITRNTTDSINLLAGCIPSAATGGKVLVLDVEHHANFLPWQRFFNGVQVLTAAGTVAETFAHLEAELKTGDYALIAVTGASNVTGESLDFKALTNLAHEYQTRVFLDGAQLVPHRRFSLAETGVDYVAFSGHKTYAPYGAGALVGRRDWLDSGKPYLAGGGAVKQVEVAKTTWAPAPARHEAGSPNVIGAVALAAACEELAKLNPELLHEHEALLRARLVAGLENLPEIEVIKFWEDSSDPVGVVTFVVKGYDPGLIAAYLSAEYGIGVRDGRFCAHPVLARLGLKSGAIRASIGVGTTLEHVDRLIVALQVFLTTGPQGEYQINNGLWEVKNDPRPVPEHSGLSGLVATAAAACASVAAGCGPAPK